MDRKLEGKIALVTGAASGIGCATAQLFAKHGANVLCADVNSVGIEAITLSISEGGGIAMPLAFDVASEAAWKSAVDLIMTRFQRLDIAVNCAGISAATPIEDLDLASWRHVMGINLEGVFLGTKYAINAMRQSKAAGSIINVASASGIKARPGASAYCTSKAGVIMFSRSAALECASRGDHIRINAISPTGVKTPLWRTMPFFQELIGKHGSEEAAYTSMEDGTPLGRFALPEEVAAAILFLASDEARFITGTNLLFDNGDVA